MEVSEMTIQDKYSYLIGMIEGCMPEDSDIVATEQLLESFLVDLQYFHPHFSPIKNEGITFVQCKDFPNQSK